MKRLNCLSRAKLFEVPGSSVGKVTKLRAQRSVILGWISGSIGNISLHLRVQTGPGTHSAASDLTRG
jgi:hypothetical protein